MNVFAYGSLMYPPVWQRVVSGTYAARIGVIRGFERRCIEGAVYPALVQAPLDSLVEGFVYLNLSAPDLAALDRFEGEGDAYRRIEVPVELEGGGMVKAWTYLYLHLDRLAPSAWDAQRFESDGLQQFLETYCRERIPG